MLDVTRDTRGEIHNANNMINADYEANKFMEYLLFENAHKDENGQCLVSDISKITPTKYYTEKHKKLKPITPAFIDTILLFKLIDSTNTFKQNGTVLIDKEVCGFWNTKIRKVAKNHNIELPKHGVVCKKPIKYVKMTLQDGEKDNSINRDAVKNILTTHQVENYKQLTNKPNLNDAYILRIKIELADEDLDTLHEKLTAFLDELKQYDNQTYLLDVDITRDYAGTFDKYELQNHLINRHKFRLQGEITEDSDKII